MIPKLIVSVSILVVVIVAFAGLAYQTIPQSTTQSNNTFGIAVIVLGLVIWLGAVFLYSGRKEQPTVTTPSKSFCIECGSKLRPYSKFCDNCGTKQVGRTQEMDME